MKKTKKFLLTVLICLTAIFSAIGFSSCHLFYENLIWENDGVLYYEFNVFEQSYSVVKVLDESAVEIIIPSSFKGKPITYISESAFYNCDSFTRVIIPDSVKSIEYDAFCECDSLTSIEIPDSVQSIGTGVFYGCTSLKSISVDENNQYYKSIDGNLYTKDGKTLVHYAIGKTDTSFAIPDNVQSIGDHAFCVCDSLTSIEIPDSVQSIGNYAFAYCSNLTSVYITDLTAWCNIDFYDDYSTPLYFANNLYLNNKLVVELVIPDSITQIKPYAFYNCDRLTSVEIPDSVQSIGDEAFGYCTSLTNIEIPDSVQSIGDEAFGYCTSLTSIEIPNSVQSIGDEAFYNCDSLTSVVIPDRVQSIGDYAFGDCTSLTSVEIGDNVQSIAIYAFENCCKLVEVYNKSSLTIKAGRGYNGYVGYYAKNVYTPTSGQSKLSTDKDGYIIYTDGVDKILMGYIGTETDLVLPNGITEIYEYAFYNCTSLTSIEIPDGVQSIGDAAFYHCDSLTSITFKDTSTWYRTDDYDDWENKKWGTKTDVTKSADNAKYFKDTYSYYYWYKL